MERRKITSDDLKKYKKILELTNAHLTDYRHGADIQITRGSKYRDVIAPLPTYQAKGYRNSVKSSVGKILMAAAAATVNRLYYDLARPTAFSTLRKLDVAAKNIKLDDVRDWLVKQDAYTLHRPIRKRFARNPYTVNNVMDVWECDLVDVQALGRFNDNYKYILSVIEVFSKFLHLVPLWSKIGKAVASAFISVFKYSSSSRRLPVWVRTGNGKEFLKRHFGEMLKREGIQFQVCRNPDVKCNVVERAHRTIRDRLYKYFTYKNTYRYIDVLPKFVKAYNDKVHSATGMAPSRTISCTRSSVNVASL